MPWQLLRDKRARELQADLIPFLVRSTSTPLEPVWQA